MKRLEPWIAWALVGFMCALSAWRRWRFLDGSPYPMGVDGYFYAGQLRSILEHGHLAWPASPLAFWLMAPLAAATDPIVGAKLGAAIGGALAGVPAYALGARLGRARGAGLVACAIATSSAGSFYLSVEFVKQGIGVTIALAALVALARALERPTIARATVAVIAAIATALTHKLAAALYGVLAIAPIVVELRARGWVRGRHLRIAAIAAAGALALAIALGLVFPARFLAPRDLALMGGVLDGRMRPELPALDLGDHALWIGHEALVALIAAIACVAIAIAWRDREARPADHALALSLAGLALFVALPWLDVGDGQGLGFRLRLIAFVPLALTGAAALGRVATVVGTRERSALLALFALAWLAMQPASRDEGVVRAHPALVAAVRALDGAVPAGDTVVVTERHIEFMAAYYARVPVTLSPAAVPRAHRWRLMPLAFIGAGSALDHALLDARRAPDLVPPRGLHPRNPDGLVLVAEPTWEWVLQHVPTKTRAWAVAWHTI